MVGGQDECSGHVGESCRAAVCMRLSNSSLASSVENICCFDSNSVDDGASNIFKIRSVETDKVSITITLQYNLE